MAMWWFQRCKNHHPHCTPATYSGRKFPNRLLEIGISSNGPTLKVVETQLLQDVEYMTLSHCWGGSLPLRLLTTNLQAFRTSIPFSSLPKTFQDAFFVLEWFGIKYLWIDALCIIQDSDNDWAHESDRMRDYYKYSSGTIAATGAYNSSEGLFFDRDPALIPPLRARISWEAGEKDVAVTVGDSCLETLRKEPLNQRGWFLQERFLSPRVLHFGRSQMSWECHNEISCETWPNTAPHLVYSPFSFALPGQITSPTRGRYDHDSIRELWRVLFSTYSRMALTELSDKCVAFAGIAEEIQAASGDDYVAGLWRRDLVEGLLWVVDRRDAKQRYSSEPSARSQSYLAPSWSWLSLNRPVILRPFGAGKKRAMVAINPEVESVTENKFGAIKHAVINGCGALIPAICTVSKRYCSFRSIRSKIIGESGIWASVSIDERQIEEANKSLYCYPP